MDRVCRIKYVYNGKEMISKALVEGEFALPVQYEAAVARLLAKAQLFDAGAEVVEQKGLPNVD